MCPRLDAWLYSFAQSRGLVADNSLRGRGLWAAPDRSCTAAVAGNHAFYLGGKEPTDLAGAVVRWLKLHESGKNPDSDGMPWLSWRQSTERLLSIILENKL